LEMRVEPGESDAPMSVGNTCVKVHFLLEHG